MKGITRRGLIGATAVIAPGLSQSACGDPAEPPAPSDPLIVDDQSRLNATRVSRNLTFSSRTPISAPADLDKAFGNLVRGANLAQQPICVGGARHSMGGQSLPPANGFAAVMSTPECEINPSAGSYTVHAGARWRDVIHALDPHGHSPAVMQSNNDFSVGGAVSVNAHGWAVPHGPVGSTVHRLRLVLADGSIVSCSPDENTNLFDACVGGYGLFGAILDAELAFAPNVLLAPSQEIVSAGEFARRFTATVHEPNVRMAYGRLCLDKTDFLTQAVLVAYRPIKPQPVSLPPASGASFTDGVSRNLFRAQTGSDAGKRLRWWAETHLLQAISRPATRNSIMNVSVRSFASSDLTRTDILHEYFVPPEAFETFVTDCRRIIPAFRQDLLNVTLRWVEVDRRSLLAFAPEPRIALVMLFSQQMTSEAQDDMRRLTQRLIDAALAAGGCFYLPYRLDARPDQLKAAYPRLAEFVAFKRRMDPHLRFRNQMWDRYFAAI